MMKADEEKKEEKKEEKAAEETLLQTEFDGVNPYSPYEGAVGSESRLIDTDKNSSLWNEINWKVDGPQRHLGGHNLIFLDNDAAPAEITAPEAGTNSTGEPAVYDPPYWNKTQDKTKPYRYRETYGTMNDNYDTWDTQIKYRK